jgi:hypothetical protein
VKLIAHDAKAMMAAMNVPVKPATGPMLIGMEVTSCADLPPGVYLLDDGGEMSAGEYEDGALARSGWGKVQA